MGTTLELSKLVAASWLKAYWSQIPRGMKIYMSTAVVVLMVITSMGIFGFLSKAHLDQNIVSGDVTSKIAIYDEKIKTSKENIDANRKALKQMDEAVDQSMVRSTSETGADKAVAIRRGQAKERSRLQAEIATEQKAIAKLNDEAAPIRAEVRKVEAEVGPIKYIAALIYGDNPDANLLEKAVTWVIMIIVSVFDPLAVLMLLGAQMTYKWHREKAEGDSLTTESDDNIVAEPTVTVTTVAANDEIDIVAEANDKIAEIDIPEPYFDTTDWQEESPKETAPTFDVVEHVKTYAKEEPISVVEAEQAIDPGKEAMRKWKEGHPDETIKETRIKKEMGIIEELPWEVPDVERPGDYLPEDDSKKKTTYIVRENNQQVLKTKD